MSYVPDLSTFYNAINKSRGFGLAPHHMPVCMGLEDDRIKRLMILGPPGTGKSTITSQSYIAWRLGKNPTQTILGISSAEKLMQGFMQAVMQIIEYSPEYKKFFPDVVPDKSIGWSTERGLYVSGRAIGDPDANFFAAGVDSKTLTGLHAKEIVMDDLHDRGNSSTAEGCFKVRDTFYDTIFGRGDPQEARYILSGRRFHKEDVYGSLMETGDWVVLRLPAERSSSPEILYYDVLVPRGITCVFTEQYRPEPIQDDSKPYIYYKVPFGVDPLGQGFYWPASQSKRIEYLSVKRNSPAKAKSVYLCDPSEREAAHFLRSDFAFFYNLKRNDIVQGISSPMVREFLTEQDGRIIQSWDTAFSKSSDAAFSVCVTAALVTSNSWWRGEDEAFEGKAERHNRVYILEVLRKKLDFRELVTEVRLQNRRWRPQKVLIENKASGISLIQSLRNSDIPIEAVQTKQGKLARATDAVDGAEGSTQGWFRQHRVVLPAGCEDWTEPFINEFIDFSGSRQIGNKDQVDATVHLVNYAISAALGVVNLPSDAEDDVYNHKNLEPVGKRAEGMIMLGGLGEMEITDPYAMSCGRCDNWDGHAMLPSGAPNMKRQNFCALHKMKTPAVGSCDNFSSFGEAFEQEANRWTR